MIIKRLQEQPYKRLIKKVKEDKKEEEILSDSTNSNSVKSCIIVKDR